MPPPQHRGSERERDERDDQVEFKTHRQLQQLMDADLSTASAFVSMSSIFHRQPM